MREPISIPLTVDDIEADPSWLERALGLAGARIVRIRRAPAAGGIAVTSRVARLLLDIVPEEGPAPRSVFVKVRNPGWKHGSALHEREVRFYCELARDHDLPAPRCYHAAFDPGSGAFVLVLEDLTELSPGHRLEGMGLAEATAALDTFARLHAAWWEPGELTARAWPRKAHDRDQAALHLRRFEEAWPSLVTMGRYPVTEAVEEAVRSLRPVYLDGLTSLAGGPGTLIHSDLHTENLLFEARPEGVRTIAVDWQNAAAGHCAFDVASLVGFSTRSEVQREHRDALLRRYHAGLCAGGVDGYPLERLREDVAAAMRYFFFGVAAWLVTFEVDSLRDAATVQGHWERLSTGLTELGR